MDSEEFCLRWNNHHTVLVTVLDKLLEKESMCDVTLAADHQFVRVHRLVLCACSNYFEVTFLVVMWNLQIVQNNCVVSYLGNAQ